MKKLSNVFLSIAFAMLFLLIGFNTLKASRGRLKTILTESNALNTSTVQSVESALKDNLWGKLRLINLLGCTEKLKGKHLVGEKQFYCDDDGMMHLTRGSENYLPLLESTEKLADILEARNIPLLVCQSAERASYGDEFNELFDGETLEYINPLKAQIEEKALYLDYSTVFKRAELSKKEIFFQTDVHYTTEAEFTALKAMVDLVERETEIEFSNKNNVLDKTKYEVVEKPFVGNLAYSIGKIYTGVDTFQFYYPKFETSMTIENPSQNLIKEGRFSEVCMNGYIENGFTSEWTYWVTDFLQYPSPYYVIKNQAVNQNDILVICDSMAFRTVSYLSLMCHSVTVLDPRSFGNQLYLVETLKNDFDMVIVIATSNLLGGIGESDPNALNAEIVSNTAPQMVDHNSSYSFNVTVKNTGTCSWSESQQNRLCIWQDGADWGYRLFLPPDITVEPGEEHTFVLNNFEMPEAESTYLEFQMLQEGVCYFGEKQRVDIVAK